MALSATGIVVALASEAKALTAAQSHPERLTPLPEGAALWLSGMGPDAAQRAAHGLADAGARALAVFGVAGALDASLRNGSLFCPERVLDEHGHDYPAHGPWRTLLQQRLVATPRPLYTHGSLLSVREPLLTAAAKTAAQHRHQALAVDMESAAVAAVAKDRHLPFMALRAIVDEMDDTIPAVLHASVDAWGRPRSLNLVVALTRHPSLLTYLPGLHSRMQQATRALRSAGDAMGPTLGWPP